MCPNDPFGTYHVDGDTNSVYQWDITGGIIYNQTGQDTVEVHWDVNSSIHQLSVVEINKYGCVGDTVTAKIVLFDYIDAKISGQDSVCQYENVSLTSVKAKRYYWSNGDTTRSTSINVTRDTSVSLVIDDGCRLDTARMDITALPLPDADFSLSPSTITPGQSVSFNSNSSGADIYTWMLGNDTLPIYKEYGEHILYYKGHYQVTLIVENQYQCVDTAMKTVAVENRLVNTITPDDDGINDTWELDVLEEYPNCKVWIFDRSHGQIFYSKGYDEPWDGTYNDSPVPDGSYFYVIDYGDGSEPHKGLITVIR